MHYDLRLEIDGVLVSWAVPKGPSLNPEQKRLAIQVEDHPMDYQDFEGIIPSGNYGAGTVILWDKGFYEIEEDENAKKKNTEKAAEQQWKKGHLMIRFKGKKLKGLFHLIRLKDDNQWLLTKSDDQFADKTQDILHQDQSIKSGKTLQQITKQSNKKKTDNRNNSKPKLKQEKFYTSLKPMLATLGNKTLPQNINWIFEVKWDGYRALSFCNQQKVSIKSRNNLDFGPKYPQILEALAELNFKAVLDGEIVVLNEEGLPDFNKLQRWQTKPEGILCYYVFDLLWQDGKDLKKLPLDQRQHYLANLIPDTHPIIRLSKPLESSFEKVVESTSALGLEGIIAKDAQSTYIPGQRSKSWLKIKPEHTDEAIICGYTQSEDPGLNFGALLLAQQKKGSLVYVGRVGTGFSQQDQEELALLFQDRKIKKAPLDDTKEVCRTGRYRTAPKNPTWLKPDLVCTIRYTERTAQGLFRHPAFIGLRFDKNPDEAIFNLDTASKQKPVNMNKKATKKSTGQTEKIH